LCYSDRGGVSGGFGGLEQRSEKLLKNWIYFGWFDGLPHPCSRDLSSQSYSGNGSCWYKTENEMEMKFKHFLEEKLIKENP
jgi:hypothetical protein